MSKNYESHKTETSAEKNSKILEERARDKSKEKALTNGNSDISYPVPDLSIKEQLNNNLEGKDKRMETEVREDLGKGEEKAMEKESNREAEDVLGIKNPRYPDYQPIDIRESEKEVVESIAKEGAGNIKRNFLPGFGIVPSASPKENFYEQVWTRDFAQASLNFFTSQMPDAAKDSLETIFRHQREDGAIPYKTEKRYALV
ncbi:MAG: hypothetical protein V1690_00655 [Candidatus Moraniibacteriota bacterium]